MRVLEFMVCAWLCVALSMPALSAQEPAAVESTAEEQSIDQGGPVIPIVEAMCQGRETLSFDSIDFTCAVERTIVESDEKRILKDSKGSYRFRFSPDVFRIDSAEERPEDPRSSYGFSFSSANGIRRTIPDRDKYTILMESAKSDDTDDKVLGADRMFLIHPSKIGCWPVGFASLDAFEFSELREFYRERDSVTFTQQEDDDGSITVRGEFEGGGSPYWWEVKLLPDRPLPESITFFGQSGPYITDNLINTWTSKNHFLVPDKSLFRKARKDGTVFYEEQWECEVVSLNEPIDPSIASWESLGIWEDAVVSFATDSGEEKKHYLDGKFGEWQPKPLYEDIDVVKVRQSSNAFLALNIGVAALLVLIFGFTKLFPRNVESINDEQT